jgi:hypothetical protein
MLRNLRHVKNGPTKHGLLNAQNSRQEHWSMLDILMIALALGFFALSVGYTVACDRL